MKNHRFLATLAGTVALMLAAVPVSAQDAGVRLSDQVHKLDRQLRESLTKAPRPERVIIRTKDGHRAALRLALEAHGDVVTGDHPEVEALSAVVHGEDLLALANDPSVESVSSDATVWADGAPAKTKVKKVQDLRKAVAAAAKEQREEARKAIRAARQAAARDRRAARGNAAKAKKDAKVKPIATGLLRSLQGLDGYSPTGSGVGVAIIDSGIEPNTKKLSVDISAFADFTQGPDPVYTSPYDDYGHGTFVASMIANDGNGGGKYQGIAPAVHLIGLKVLDSNGAGTTSAVIQAIEFAIRHKDDLDIDIINLSLGHPIFESAATDPLVIAVEEAHAAGIVVVASAGNYGLNPNTNQVGYGGITSPGNAPSAITVGAVDQNDTQTRGDDSVAPFSSRGPTWIDGFAKPDLVAPGVGEVSRMAKAGNLFKYFPQVRYNDPNDVSLLDLAKLSGTSMAAAAASGIVALVMQANPALPPNAIKAVLEYTATPLGDSNGQPLDALTQGAGEVNAAGAVALASAIDVDSCASGWVVGNVPLSTHFGNQDEAWSQNIVWGNYFVAGLPGAMFANGLPYDDNIVWGTVGRASDDNIVWGTFARDGNDNIVWGSLAVWGSRYDTEQRDNIVWGNFARVDDNIVWGSFARGGDNIVWGSFLRGGDNIVWGSVSRDGDNIVWGNNIVWANNVVWGSALLGARDGDNIVWGNLLRWDGDVDNIVWGNLFDDNVVWGNLVGRGDGDNVVWGNSVVGF
jgi:serine protease AprX